MSVQTAIPNRKVWRLEELAKHFGPIIFHRHFSKIEFAGLARQNPELRMEHLENGSIKLISLP